MLVDDHTLLRQGLLSIVSAYNHFEIVGEAGDGEEAVELAERLRPDVIVMDIHMPRMDGIEATKRIKANRPEVIIIGLSVNESADMAQRMKAAGVTVYLTKESAADTLCRAIEAEVIQKRNSSDLPQAIQIDDLMQLGKPLGGGDIDRFKSTDLQSMKRNQYTSHEERVRARIPPPTNR